jgi:beta-lactamase regulating signal transducer with metallopeptidase domain
MNGIVQYINSIGEVFVHFAAVVLVESIALMLLVLLLAVVPRKKITASLRYWLTTLVFVPLVLMLITLLYISLEYWNSGAILAQAPSTEAGATAALPPVTWQGALLLGWLVAILLMALIFIQRALSTRKLVANAKKANGLMEDALVHCCKCMDIKTKVGLRVAADGTSPAVCGLFRPTILVPENLAPTLGSRHLRAVLLHELAHIKRGDLWVNFGQRLIQIVYFYTPLVWIIGLVMRKLREHAVNEEVRMVMGERAPWYAETLAGVAKLGLKRPGLGLCMIGMTTSSKDAERQG